MSFSVTFGGLPCLDPYTEYQEQERLGYDLSWADKANSFSNPLGSIPGKGWILLLRSTLNKLNLDTRYDLVFSGSDNNLEYRTLTLKQMLIIKAVCLTPGKEGDENAAYLVEIVDKRLSAMNKPINFQINILSPDSASTYYLATVDTRSVPSGVPWTWESAIGRIWELNGSLGIFPGLPYSPNGIPEGFQFIGVDSYEAITILLAKIHCALRYSPILDTYTIVSLGQTEGLSALIANKRPYLIYDGEVLESNRARIANIVRVHFHKSHIHYGQEVSTESTALQWTTNSIEYKEYFASDFGLSIDVTGLDPTNTQILWDDLHALVDHSGNITNATALQSRGRELAEKYYSSMISGGNRLLKKYSGIHGEFVPSGELKYVCWKLTKAGAITEIARTIGFIDGMDIISQYTYLEKAENLTSPDFSRATYPNYFPQIQILQILGNSTQANYYRAKVSYFNCLTDALVDREECWAACPDTITLSEGDICFGKISGKKEISKETLPVYYVIPGGAGPSANIALVKVKDYRPILVFSKYDYFPAKIIKFNKNEITNEVVSQETTDCYVAITHLRQPELDFIHMAVQIAVINGIPLFRINTEYVRFVKPGSSTPIKNSIYYGTGYGLDYGDEGPVSILISNNVEQCFINDLRFIDSANNHPSNVGSPEATLAPPNDKTLIPEIVRDGTTFRGSVRSLDTNSFYIGRYQGILNIDNDIRPSYAIDSDYISVGVSSSTEITPIVKKIVFEEDNFDVENAGYGNAYVKGVLFQNQGVSLHRRKKLNFKTLPYPAGIPEDPVVPFIARDNPVTGATDVIFYVVPGAVFISLVAGNLPIYIDSSIPGKATVNLEIPLKVIYGGTQRTSLDQGATLIGDNINPVALRAGDPYTIFNHKFNYNYPFPEWAIWSKIRGVTQTGIPKIYGTVRPLEEIPVSSSNATHCLALHFDKYDYRYIVVTNSTPTLVPNDYSVISSGFYNLAILKDQPNTIGTIGLKRQNNHSNTLTEYDIILPASLAERATGPYVYDLYLKDGKLGIRHISENNTITTDTLLPLMFNEDVDFAFDKDILRYANYSKGKIFLENIVGFGRGGATSLETGEEFQRVIGNTLLQGVSNNSNIDTKTYTTYDIIIGYTYMGRLGYFADISQNTLESTLNRFIRII